MKEKLLLLCTLIPILAAPLTSTSMKIDTSIKTEDIDKTLKNKSYLDKLNLDGFSSNQIEKYEINKEEFLKIAEQAQKDPIILKWMSSILENNMTFEVSINILFSLDLSQETKEFMFNGLYDKMSVQESKLILKMRTIKARNQVKSYYVESSGEYVRNIDDSYVRNKGLSRTIPEIHDSWFDDDVSYIRYNTQDVYNVYTKGLDRNFVRKLQKSIKKYKQQ